MLRYRDAFTLPALLRTPRSTSHGYLKQAPRRSLLPLGRRCPEGADEGAFEAGKYAPTLFSSIKVRAFARMATDPMVSSRQQVAWPTGAISAPWVARSSL